MKYISTRGNAPELRFSEILLGGLALDGRCWATRSRDPTGDVWGIGVDDAAALDQGVVDPAREQFDEIYDHEVASDIVLPSREGPKQVDPTLIVATTAADLGIPVAQLCSRRRTPIEVVGREAVVHSAKRAGLTGIATAHALGVSQQAVSRIACRGIGAEAIALGDRVLERLESQSILV